MGNERTKKRNAQRKRARAKAAKPPAPLAEDDDESFADRAVQAIIDHACGVDNPDYDWLVEPYE